MNKLFFNFLRIYTNPGWPWAWKTYTLPHDGLRVVHLGPLNLSWPTA